MWRAHDEGDTFVGLAWSIKGSFVRYVAGLADGRAMLAGDVVMSQRLGLIFPLATGSTFQPAAGAGTLKFGGKVSFRGHFGMLGVDIGAPWLSIAGDGGQLSIDDPADPTARLCLAGFDIEWDDARRWASGSALRLTEAGAALFGGSYPPGGALDPFIVRLA